MINVLLFFWQLLRLIVGVLVFVIFIMIVLCLFPFFYAYEKRTPGKAKRMGKKLAAFMQAIIGKNYLAIIALLALTGCAGIDKPTLIRAKVDHHAYNPPRDYYDVALKMHMTSDPQYLLVVRQGNNSALIKVTPAQWRAAADGQDVVFSSDMFTREELP